MHALFNRDVRAGFELFARARLELSAEACDAVHYGHQHGVIHRHRKPDNILIDGAVRSQRIDFGVARTANADVASRHSDIGNSFWS